MPVTLRDIARRLNVSPSLVSGVLNDKSGVWASEKTRARIRAAAHELGYRPHSVARALGSGRSYSVAFACLREADGSFRQASVIGTLAEQLNRLGYDLRISTAGNSDDLLARLSDLTHSRACDAVVLWGDEPEVEAQGEFLEAAGVPFVVKGRHEARHPLWPQIDFDHEGMMSGAVTQLAAQGHRRIAYLGFGHQHLYRFHLLEGYRQAVQALLGHPAPKEWEAESGGTPVFAEAQMTRWLTMDPNRAPTALVIGTGNEAWLGAELALARAGRRIGPDDFGVCGACDLGLTLLFGEGRGYRDLDLPRLARAMAEQLLCPLLREGSVSPTVVRALPVLHALDSHRLLDADLPLLTARRPVSTALPPLPLERRPLPTAS